MFKINFDSAALATISRLQEALGGVTMAEVIRDALGFYDWARQQRAEGYTVATIKGDKPIQEVLLRFPSNA